MNKYTNELTQISKRAKANYRKKMFLFVIYISVYEVKEIKNNFKQNKVYIFIYIFKQ